MPEQRQLLVLEVTSTGVRVVKGDLDALGGTGERTINTFGRLKSILGGLISARMIRDVVMLADNYATMLNRVRVVTRGHEELRIAMRGVADISRATRSSLEANAAMYSRIAINTADFGLSQQQVLDFTKQLNQAIILSGVTAREAEWGMVQFSQGLASGALRGDELRAVLEQLPVVTQVLADHLKVGRGELRNMGFQGKITTQVMIQAFKEANDDLERRFGKTIPTINQSITTLRSSWQSFIGSLDQSTGITRVISSALLGMADNMNLFGRAAIAAGAALTGVLIVSMLRTLQVGSTLKLLFTWFATNPWVAVFTIAAVAVIALSDKFGGLRTANYMVIASFEALGDAISLVTETAGALLSLLNVPPTEITLSKMIQSSFAGLALVLDSFLAFMQGLKDLFVGIVVFIVDKIKEAGQAITSWAKDMLSRLSNFRRAVEVIARGGGAGAGMSLFESLEKQRELQNKFLERATAASQAGAEDAGMTLADRFFSGFRDRGTPLFDAAMKIITRSDQLQIQSEYQSSRNPTEIFTPAEQQMKRQITGPLEQYEAQFAALQRLRELGEKEGGLEKGGITLDEYNRALDQITQKAATNERALKFMVENGVIDPVRAARAEWQLMNDDLKNHTDILSGIKRGMTDVLLTITDYASQSQKVVTNAFSNMEDAFVELAKTGKFSFKGMIDGMLADLTRLMFRMLVVKALSAFGGGGGGLLGSIAGAFGGGGGGGGGAGASPAAGGMTLQSFGGLPPVRAFGGPASPGGSYWVGDQGRPELFTPAKPGRVSADVPSEKSEPAQVTVINVNSMEEAYAAMRSTEGQRIILNTKGGRQ